MAEVVPKETSLWELTGADDLNAEAGVPRETRRFLPEPKSGDGWAVLSGLASKCSSQGTSIRPTGQLSNSGRLT